jgi:transposase InsO family protein
VSIWIRMGPGVCRSFPPWGPPQCAPLFGLLPPRLSSGRSRFESGTVGVSFDHEVVGVAGEAIDRRAFRSHAEARTAIFRFIEGWYNPHRRHSTLGYVSPMNYERLHANAA